MFESRLSQLDKKDRTQTTYHHSGNSITKAALSAEDG